AVRADDVTEACRIPLELADELARVRIEQQLVLIEAMALLRLVRPVHAIAVYGIGPEPGEIAMPDLVGKFRQLDAFDLRRAGAVEQAKLDLGCVGGEQREVDAFAVPDGAARVGKTFAKLKCLVAQARSRSKRM